MQGLESNPRNPMPALPENRPGAESGQQAVRQHLAEKNSLRPRPRAASTLLGDVSFELWESGGAKVRPTTCWHGLGVDVVKTVNGVRPLI